MGPSLKGMGVSVLVGVLVAVGVRLWAGVSVGIRVGVDGLVDVAGKVGRLVIVDAGLMKNTFLDEFIQNQAATRNSPAMRLTTQNPVTRRRRLLDEAAGISMQPLLRYDATNPGRY